MEEINTQKETLKLYRHIISLENKRNKLIMEIFDKKHELQQVCQHIDVETRNECIEGGYYDKTEYITKKVCKTCKKELSKTSKFGGYC